MSRAGRTRRCRAGLLRDLTRLAQPAAPVARGVVVAAPDYDSEPARVGSAVAEPEEFRGGSGCFGISQEPLWKPVRSAS